MHSTTTTVTAAAVFAIVMLAAMTLTTTGVHAQQLESDVRGSTAVVSPSTTTATSAGATEPTSDDDDALFEVLGVQVTFVRALIGAGAVLVLLLLAITCCCCCRRRKRRQREELAGNRHALSRNQGVVVVVAPDDADDVDIILDDIDEASADADVDAHVDQGAGNNGIGHQQQHNGDVEGRGEREGDEPSEHLGSRQPQPKNLRYRASGASSIADAVLTPATAAQLERGVKQSQLLQQQQQQKQQKQKQKQKQQQQKPQQQKQQQQSAATTPTRLIQAHQQVSSTPTLPPLPPTVDVALSPDAAEAPNSRMTGSEHKNNHDVDVDEQEAERRAQEERERQTECVICLADERDALLVPCGHLCLCSDCAMMLVANNQTCPMCRCEVEQIISLDTAGGAVGGGAGVGGNGAAGQHTNGRIVRLDKDGELEGAHARKSGRHDEFEGQREGYCAADHDDDAPLSAYSQRTLARALGDGGGHTRGNYIDDNEDAQPLQHKHLQQQRGPGGQQPLQRVLYSKKDADRKAAQKSISSGFAAYIKKAADHAAAAAAEEEVAATPVSPASRMSSSSSSSSSSINSNSNCSNDAASTSPVLRYRSPTKQQRLQQRQLKRQQRQQQQQQHEEVENVNSSNLQRTQPPPRQQQQQQQKPRRYQVRKSGSSSSSSSAPLVI